MIQPPKSDQSAPTATFSDAVCIEVVVIVFSRLADARTVEVDIVGRPSRQHVAIVQGRVRVLEPDGAELGEGFLAVAAIGILDDPLGVQLAQWRAIGELDLVDIVVGIVLDGADGKQQSLAPVVSRHDRKKCRLHVG
jgi:hypothetical protein